MLIRIEGSDELAVVAEADEEAPFFAGDLRALSVADILALLNSGRQDGRLLFELDGDVRKTLFLTDGEITFASSTAHENRLGQVLWRSGIISHEQLKRAADRLSPEVRIGELLVEDGAITPADIYKGLVSQVRDIVLSLFSSNVGRFLFVAGQTEAVDKVQLDDTTHELVMAGLRRLDDLEELRLLVPLDVVFERRSMSADLKLTSHEEVVLSLVDGVRTAKEVMKESQLGEKDGLQTLHSLSEARFIGQRKAAAAAAARLDAGAPFVTEASSEAASGEVGELLASEGDLFGDEVFDEDGEAPSGSRPIDLFSSEGEDAAKETAGSSRRVESVAGGGINEGLESVLEPEAVEEAPAEAASSETREESEAEEASAEGEGAGEPRAEVPRELVLEAARMPFAAYSKVAARIYGILRKARRDPDALGSYFETPPEAYAPVFEGVHFEDGQLDMARILGNARQLSEDQYKGRALEALEAFQSFALFQAKSSLPPDVAAKVQRLVMLIHLGKA